MIHAFAAFKAKQPLQPYEYREPKLQPHEVVIQIDYCGLCYSDVHLIDNDWLISKYPLVPGHEIIGTILEKGSQVRGVDQGQRIGVGWQSSSCLSCEHCIGAEETFCTAKERTCIDRFGGFADKIVVDSRFVYSIPEKLDSETAAPLLCGGITVYSPFKIYGVQAPMSVAVIGIGGLGHLALQFGRAFGCDVTAISSSKDKKTEAHAFGASHFISLDTPSALEKAICSFDFILSTVHADLDWNLIATLLRPKGRLCFVGLPQNDIKIPARLLISGNRSLCGSGTGSRALMQEMLQFAARHQIKAKTELFPLSEINQAIERLKNNKARYRIVLKIK